MRKGLAIKPLILLALVGLLALATSGWTTQAPELTWDELKAVQTTERTEMLKAEADQFEKLLARQHEEITVMAGNSSATPSSLQSLAAGHSDERKELARIAAEERKELAHTHAEERKAFFTGRGDPKSTP